MDEKEQDNVAAFDMLFTTNRIQIMKTILPCLDRPMQKYLAIYIKYQELQYTISYFEKHSHCLFDGHNGQKQDIRKVLPALLPYCSDAQKQMLQRFEQLMSSMETYREMMEMMEMMQSMSDSSSQKEGSPDGNGMQMPDIDTLLSMLGPEQQAIMELLKGGMNHE